MENEPKVVWEGKGQLIYDFRIEPSAEKQDNTLPWKTETLRDAWKYSMSVAGASGEHEGYVPGILFLADTRDGLIRDMATYIDIALKKADRGFLNLPPMNPDNIKISDSTGVFNSLDLNAVFRNAAAIAAQLPPPGEAVYIIEIREDESREADKRYTAKIIYANGALNYSELSENDAYLKEGVDKFSNISAQQVPQVIAHYILTKAVENEIQPTQLNTKIVNFTNNPEFTLNQIASYIMAMMPQVMPQQPYTSQMSSSAVASNPYNQYPEMPYQQEPGRQMPNAHPIPSQNQVQLKQPPEPSQQNAQQPKEKATGTEDSGESEVEKNLSFYEPDYGFDSVIGMDDAKDFLYDNIILGLKRPDLFKKYKKSIHDGFILYGPPGTGKTYLVGALAHEAKIKLLVVNIHQLLDQYVGNTEKNVHAIFEQARKNAPCIILFDEIDGLGMSRNASGESGNRSSTLALNQILMEMDSLGTKNEDIMIIGTTNEPQDIDTALLRSGRFTNLMYVRPPDEEVREKLFKFYSEGIPKEDVDYRKLGEESTNFSPADIKATVKAAVTPLIAEAAEGGAERELTTEDLLKSIRKRRASGSTMIKWYEDMKKILKRGGFTEEEKLEYGSMLEDIKRRVRSPKKTHSGKRRLRA